MSRVYLGGLGSIIHGKGLATLDDIQNGPTNKNEIIGKIEKKSPTYFHPIHDKKGALSVFFILMGIHYSDIVVQFLS